jgi:hypothetical protein
MVEVRVPQMPFSLSATRPEKGWTLPSVMALTLLVGSTVLSLVQQLWWQERLLKLQAERLRNRAMAEAVWQLALQDVQGVDPQSTALLRHTMGDAGQTHVFFPHTLAEREVLRTRLHGAPCRDGICVTDNHMGNTQPLPLPTLTQRLAQTDSARSVSTPEGRPAWYWVEVLVNADPAAKTPFYYRITSLAEGSLPGGRVALEAIWQSDNDTHATRPGHGLSWRWLTP